MGDPKGFLKVKRNPASYRPVNERIKDYNEIVIPPALDHHRQQASRCMDCGTPFCHWGCPIGNYIPEWNDLLYRGHWQDAYRLLEITNTLPEITGRVCPSCCEYACVLGINDDAVTIRENELAIAEEAFKRGWVKPSLPSRRTGKKVAIVGSGPAGLSCAARLNKSGHTVVVFERNDNIGGILRYGIPDFKLNKDIIDRRVEIWKKEGIIFKTGVNVGVDYSAQKLKKEFDAICLAGGARVPRDLSIEGRGLKGIYFAMDYLTQSNRRVKGEIIREEELIDSRGKKVVIIGGGDTGADCVGVAHRQGARSVTQIELLERPPEQRTSEYPWPTYPVLLKTSTSHDEGGRRIWSVLTKSFIGERGYVKRLSCVKIKFIKEKNRHIMREIPASKFQLDADLVIIAIGFLHPEHEGLLEELGIELDARGNVKTGRDYMTSKKGIFSCGDMHRGQSLIVWAIYEGCHAARYIDSYLQS